MKTGGIHKNSFLGSWLNRRQGFERLEQFSDGENELFDGKVVHHSNDNSDDETFNVSTKPQGTHFNTKSPTTTIQMNNNL